MTFSRLFPHSQRVLIGVVHLPALPGAPGFDGNMHAVLDHARRDAQALAEGGVDGVIVENFGDRPFFGESVPSETVAGMALALQAVREQSGNRPVGVNVLRNDARSALGLAAVLRSEFFRVNVHVSAAVTDQGILQGRAAETVRERARLCPETLILADVHVKHATPLGHESIGQAAGETFGRGMADALILSGEGTGHAPDANLLEKVRRQVPGAPLLIGSGLSEENSDQLLPFVDGAIVGTSLKSGPDWQDPIDVTRVKSLVARVHRAGDRPSLGASRGS